MNARKNREVALVLCDVRSAHNVGSIFRTADGAGVSKAWLCGYTPAPVDRFGRTRKDLAKVSLGAEKAVPWEHADDAVKLVRKLRKDGYFVVAVEQDERALDYRKLKPNFPLALVLGNELGGVPKRVLDECDAVAEIPMRGAKESLNVSVAAGIALFRFAE